MDIAATGMPQEVDIRYVDTSLEGSAEHLYKEVYCQRGQRGMSRRAADEGRSTPNVLHSA
jgi:hypothetical protein